MALTKVGKEGITGISNSSDATAITIDSSENVGIGTTSPGFSNGSGLEVAKATTACVRIEGNSAAHALELYADSSGGTIDARGSGAVLALDIGGSEAVRIDNSGKVGVNTTSPSSSTFMTIQSGSTTGSLTLNGPTTNGYYAQVVEMPSGSTYGFLFKNDGSAVGSIRINASSTAYNTSSDYRLKQGVEDMTGAIDRVKAMAPKRFQFIADADTTVDGFLAHEAQAVVPEAVTGTKDEVDEDGNAVMQGIDQSKLVPLLTGALKEAVTKIEALEARVKTLEDA
tara:strand:+ start:57 stop:905 length:849 start_codon:yes stop_codon:yes gene_type:complete